MDEKELLREVLNHPQFRKDISEGARAEIIKNFKEGGRYGSGILGGGTKKWKPSKRVIKKGGKTLIDKGILYSSITVDTKADVSGITLDVESVGYGLQHQYGNPAKKLPARPWATLPDEFVEKVIIKAFRTHFNPNSLIEKLNKLLGGR